MASEGKYFRDIIPQWWPVLVQPLFVRNETVVLSDFDCTVLKQWGALEFEFLVLWKFIVAASLFASETT